MPGEKGKIDFPQEKTWVPGPSLTITTYNISRWSFLMYDFTFELNIKSIHFDLQSMSSWHGVLLAIGAIDAIISWRPYQFDGQNFKKVRAIAGAI